MNEPKLKRTNTVAVRFATGERTDHAVIHLLKHHFNLQGKDVFGVGNEGKNSIYVKFKSTLVYNDVCTKHHGKYFTIDGETKVQLLDVSSYLIKVSMKNVPFELNNQHLEQLLEKYGKVRRVLFHTKQDDWFEQGTLSMERTAYMHNLTTPIPSTLLVNLTGTYIYFSYPNQIRTCNRCGESDHTAPECPVNDRKHRSSYVKPENRGNVININYDEDFPDTLGSTIPKSNSDNAGTPDSQPDHSVDIPLGEETLSSPSSDAQACAAASDNQLSDNVNKPVDAQKQPTQEKCLNATHIDNSSSTPVSDPIDKNAVSDTGDTNEIEVSENKAPRNKHNDRSNARKENSKATTRSKQAVNPT